MSDSSGFREIAKSVRIDHPIPYLCVVFGALALASLGLTAVVPSPASLTACGLGVLFGLCAVGLPVWAALRHPELLRSERHVQISRAFDIMLDEEATENARSKAGEIVEVMTAATDKAPNVPHRQIGGPVTAAKEDNDG